MGALELELELELIQSHMAQKPMLRGEVGARALRVRSDVRGHGQVRLCKALGCGRCGCLKPIRACCVVGSAFFLVAPPRGGCAMAPRDSGMCWKQFMMCLEDIQFVAGVHSPPMHDPGRRRNSRPCDGSASARAPVCYLVSSVVVVGVEDRPPLGDLGCALRHRPALVLRSHPGVAPWLPHEGLANGEGGRGHELVPPGAVLRQVSGRSKWFRWR